MNRELILFSFFRSVIAVGVAWAVIGTFTFTRIIEKLGLAGISIEMKFLVFVGVTLVPVIGFMLIAVAVGLSRDKNKGR